MAYLRRHHEVNDCLSFLPPKRTGRGLAQACGPALRRSFALDRNVTVGLWSRRYEREARLRDDLDLAQERPAALGIAVLEHMRDAWREQLRATALA